MFNLPFDELFPPSLWRIYTYPTLERAYVNDKKEIVYELPLPGLGPKDIKLEFLPQNKRLTISYNKNNELKIVPKVVSITVPDEYDSTKTKAEMKNGLLKITIPLEQYKNSIEIKIG